LPLPKEAIQELDKIHQKKLANDLSLANCEHLFR